MPDELLQLFRDINTEKLRIRRPSRFVFFCGGAMNDLPGAACSLRHYLLRDQQIGRRFKAHVILAEKANQLYRDTTYSDLVTFEEDIARIAAMVLLIAESPGSLAELGAFAAIESIRGNLAVLIQTEHYEANSFVRFGPIEKIKKEDERRIGVYPWRRRKSGSVIQTSIKPHVASMVRFINDILKKVPKEELYESKYEIKIFILILWILHLSQAMPITELHERTNSLIQIKPNDLKNKLFCMKLAGWVSNYTYESKTYWFSVSQVDPFSRYSFVSGVVNDPLRRKNDVIQAIGAQLKLPKHVKEHVVSKKVEL